MLGFKQQILGKATSLNFVDLSTSPQFILMNRGWSGWFGGTALMDAWVLKVVDQTDTQDLAKAPYL